MGERDQWRPTSACQAAQFDEDFCSQCERDAAFRAGEGDSCPIAAQGFGVAIGLDPPPEWIVGLSAPTCTAFAALQGDES